MNGATNHVDTFDPERELTRYHGEPYKGDLTGGSNMRAVAHLMGSPFESRKHGQSRLEISRLFPHTGLWEETLFVWGGGFGRTPTSESVGKTGRDHDWHGFSMWLAGAGVKRGQALGATNELGLKAVEEPIRVSDLHATILYLMGRDRTRLTYFYSGLQKRNTGVRGNVVKKVML